jgi:uncharacterized protein (TIGR04255 family)
VTIHLPPADRSRLPHSPLKLVVWQLRFGEESDISEPPFLFALKEALGGDENPYQNSNRHTTQSLTIQMGPGPQPSPNQTALETGWRLTSVDSAWIVTVMPTSLSLETATGYISWSDDFELRLRVLLEAFFEIAEPQLEERLGLRYVDQIAMPNMHSPKEWSKTIHSSLLGTLKHPVLGGALVTDQQHHELQLADGVRCVLRHGFFRDASNGDAWTYVLDTDVSRQELRQMDVDNVERASNAFSEIGTSVFQQCVTQKYLDYLKGSDG